MSLFEKLKSFTPIESTPHERAEAFYARSVEAARFSREVVIPVLTGILAPNVRESAAILLYCRMHAWGESLAVFDRGVHYQAAASAARSLFELLIDLLLLAADRDGKDVERFISFPDVERYRVAERLVAYRRDHPEFTLVDPAVMEAFVASPGKEEVIDARRLHLWGPDKRGKPQAKHHWSGMDLPRRAKRLGPKYESHYVELYAQLSWHIHAGSVGTAGRSEEDFDNACGMAHAYAQEFFLEAMAVVGKDLRLADAIPGYFTELNRLLHLPGMKLLGTKMDKLHSAP